MIAMTLKFRCPKCGKGENSELIEILPGRRYRMRCGECKSTYILTASQDTDKKDEESEDDCCCCE